MAAGGKYLQVESLAQDEETKRRRHEGTAAAAATRDNGGVGDARERRYGNIARPG